MVCLVIIQYLISTWDGFLFIDGLLLNENSFERSSKGFLPLNLGAVEDKRFQLFDPPQAESFEIACSKP